MDLETHTAVAGDVTFVSVLVSNPYDEPARFRLQNTLDGPVWPPRTRGHPEAGWDEDGYEGVLAPGERRPLGYATPGGPSDTPVAVAWMEPAGDSSVESTPDTSVLRTFGDPRPPRSVVSPFADGLHERNPDDSIGDRSDSGEGP